MTVSTGRLRRTNAGPSVFRVSGEEVGGAGSRVAMVYYTDRQAGSLPSAHVNRDLVRKPIGSVSSAAFRSHSISPTPSPAKQYLRKLLRGWNIGFRREAGRGPSVTISTAPRCPAFNRDLCTRACLLSFDTDPRSVDSRLVTGLLWWELRGGVRLVVPRLWRGGLVTTSSDMAAKVPRFGVPCTAPPVFASRFVFHQSRRSGSR